ncbi:TrmH family RNA methyltransferase [Sulfobacillus harzensis]|uniref:RNA methyltransferase n=1 Tax=Sulfobacillus harzensis TaxID=2729629 RepID=A0A7Y0L3R2_9FIRM|nr:RNA methyltransferase [Sulfobacillus harzensis]NMP22372.1 RNA methyltransferase [Sulfobacillus harzensis]
MVIQPLDSADNKMIRRIKRLNTSRQARIKSNATVVEGGRLLEEALAAGFQPQLVVYSPKWVERVEGRAMLTRLQARSTSLFYVTDRLFEELSQVETPQGILAVISLPRSVTLGDLLDKSPQPLLFPIALGIQDPGNLGTLMRAALAAGAHALGVASGTVEAFNPKCLRASAGAAFRLPVVSLDEGWPDVLRTAGVTIRTTAVDRGLPYHQADWTGSTALVLGNEGNGLDPAWYRDTEVVTIPMSPASESLNVSMAGAIVLFHAAFRRQEKGIGFAPPAMV